MRAGATFGEARDRHLNGLDDRDRRLAYELAAGTLRHQRELDGELDLAHADARLHDVLRLGAYQLRLLSRVPPHAAVSTAVELARETAGEGAARYVNQALRRLTREGGRGEREGGRGKGEGAATHPPWLVERWRLRLGAEETARLLAWNDTRPALVLQSIRWNATQLTAQLEAAGVSFKEAPFGAGVEILADRDTSRIPRPTSLPGFAEGGFVVQDPAQALVVRFAAIPTSARVYDACAAPGGKSVSLERSGAIVFAGEGRRARVRKLTETTRRCGRAIRVVAADLTSPPFAARSWDAVMVDAPCTATGTMARHPDARWRITPAAIARAAKRQRQLLEAAADLTRPGGVLVYATCSLEPEENADQVDHFLGQHPEFVRAPVAGVVPPALVSAAGDFQSLPFRDQIDGAYAARLRREH